MFTAILHNKALREKTLLIEALKKFVEGLENHTNTAGCVTFWNSYEPQIDEKEWQRILAFFTKIKLDADVNTSSLGDESDNEFNSDEENVPSPYVRFPTTWRIKFDISKEAVAMELDRHFPDLGISVTPGASDSTGLNIQR